MKNFIVKICFAFIFFHFWQPAYSQLCTGTLGEPVVNFDFGRGTNVVGPQLKNKLPNLTYALAACNPDGQYAIRQSLLTSCFNTWHILPEDHTPTENDGYMMILNATNAPGDFYIDTIKGVCGDNVYEFAAWVVNLQKIGSFPNPSYPNLDFRIETINGTLLASNKTNPIPETATPVWKQYGLFFKTPPGAQTLVLRIYNAAPAGFGNDFALDDITFRPCGPTFNIALVGNPGNSIDQCFSETKDFPIQATLGTGYANPTIVWQSSLDNGDTWTDIPGSNTLSYNFRATAPGNYKVRASVAEASNVSSKDCRVVSNEVTLNLRELAGNGSGVGNPACTGDLVVFNGGDGTTFKWTGPNGFTSNQKNPSFVATLSQAGTYYLESTSTFGCNGKDTFDLIITPSPTAVVSGNASICENDTITLTASGGSFYKWLPASGLSSDTVASPTVVLNTTTTYNVIVSEVGGCKDTATVTVSVSGVPKANAGPDRFMLLGQTVTLLGTAEGSNVTYEWLPNSFLNKSNTLTPIANPPTDFTYQLKVTSNAGCGEAMDEVFVKVFAELKIPNAFSPNGDGINDTWRLDVLAVYPESVVIVFDRYGQQVFKTKGHNLAWDGSRNGKPAPVGVYYYLIDTKNGSDVFRGSITLIR